MSSPIHCPHCRETLDGANPPAQTALMCPYCEKLFLLDSDSSGPGQAPSGITAGVNGGYSYSDPTKAMPRPAGVTGIGVTGIIISSFIVLSMTCLGVMFSTMDLFPALAEKVQNTMSEGESLPGDTTDSTIGVLMVFSIGLVCLWASIGLLRRKEIARRIVWGISLCGVIVTVLLLSAVVKELQEVETLTDHFKTIVLFLYSVWVCIYLRCPVVKNWFAG